MASPEATPEYFADERAMLVAAASSLFEANVMSHTGHANLSMKISDNEILLSTKGSIRNLSADELAIVTLDGDVVQGFVEPINAEIIHMHTSVYRRRPDTGSVIHTHSPMVTSFAMANVELPCRYETLLRFGQTESLPLVPWAPRGSEQSVKGIDTALQTRPNTRGALLGNHGVLAFGDSPASAALLIMALEEAAILELEAAAIGGAADLPADALTQSLAHERAVQAGSHPGDAPSTTRDQGH